MGPPVSAETARAALAGAVDGDLALRLDRIYGPDDSVWQVPAYRFDLMVAGARAGTISLRVGQDERLLRYTGHIGYGVDMPWRGRGVAHRAIILMLPLARAHQLEPVWISCNPDNLASRRTIERAGGRYIETVALTPDEDRYWRRGEREKCRFRLDLPPA